MTRRKVLMVAAALLALAATPASAAEGRYTDVQISDAKDGKPKQTFTTTTEKIFVRAKLADVPRGTKLKAVWIAEKTKVAPPNYAIDSSELERGALDTVADFWMSKPTKGWPEGEYRVDLLINGKVMSNVRFKIQ